MARFIVRATYRVETPLDDTVEEMEAVEAQRWEMFQGKYGVEPLEITVESEPIKV